VAAQEEDNRQRVGRDQGHRDVEQRVMEERVEAEEQLDGHGVRGHRQDKAESEERGAAEGEEQQPQDTISGSGRTGPRAAPGRPRGRPGRWSTWFGGGSTWRSRLSRSAGRVAFRWSGGSCLLADTPVGGRCQARLGRRREEGELPRSVSRYSLQRLSIPSSPRMCWVSPYVLRWPD
jgi:hypothetical protein